MRRSSVAGVPLLGPPALAAEDEAVDATPLAFLVDHALDVKEEQVARKEPRCGDVSQGSIQQRTSAFSSSAYSMPALPSHEAWLLERQEEYGRIKRMQDEAEVGGEEEEEEEEAEEEDETDELMISLMVLLVVIGVWASLVEYRFGRGWLVGFSLTPWYVPVSSALTPVR